MTELAKSYGQGPVALGDIASAENLSVAYLEQLLAHLRRAGLVGSTRGAHGGYELTRRPEEMTVGEVVRVLEGPIAPVECVAETEDPVCCERASDCASRQVWQRVRDSILAVLDSTTLADLCRGTGAGEAETRPPAGQSLA